ncbi:hypothetical protein D3C87_1731140 [compost metagenome]
MICNFNFSARLSSTLSEAGSVFLDPTFVAPDCNVDEGVTAGCADVLEEPPFASGRAGVVYTGLEEGEVREGAE